MSGVPICERLRAYQAPGYGPSSPIRRDATEARETIEALVEALATARMALIAIADIIDEQLTKANAALDLARNGGQP